MKNENIKYSSMRDADSHVYLKVKPKPHAIQNRWRPWILSLNEHDLAHNVNYYQQGYD